MDTYTFTTSNPALFAQVMALASGSAAPPAAPAAPPVAPPAAPAEPHGEPPPGWTIQHVISALQALGSNPAKGGPAAVKAILDKFGAKKVTDINPARWPEVYQAASA